MPRPLWIGVAAAELLFAEAGLQFGLPIYRQQIAIRAIERMGGTVLTLPSGPEWLRRWIGDERMKPLDKVSCVGFEGQHLTGEAFRHVACLTNLRSLDLAGTQITGEALCHLKGLKLRTLTLREAYVTNSELDQLSGISSLTQLDLSGTNVTDDGLEYLKGLTNLQILGLSNTKITDAGLEHLQDLTSLMFLHLYSTKVTDTGLAYLKRLKKLNVVHLRETQVTAAGVNGLKAAIPKVEVEFDSR
jgi:hypothetical protein